MKFKSPISEYTESEFLDFVRAIFREIESPARDEFSKLIWHFKEIVEHPESTDLIFYSSEEAYSPEAVTRIIKKWMAENGKPGFKPATST